MKFFKKIRIFSLLLLLCLGFSIKSYADDFSSLDISLKIDKNSLGSVKEVWKTAYEKGSAKYKPIENLGHIKREDFKARVNRRDFTEESPWKVGDPFDDKAYKYGINPTDKGIKLCRGISNYGSNRHETSYKINPLIISLNDYTNQALVESKQEDRQGQVSKPYSTSSTNSKLVFIILAFIALGFILVILLIVLIFKMAKNLGKGKASNFDKENKLPKLKKLKGQYYRDIPYQGPIENLYLFNKKAFDNFNTANMLNAFILKWIYQSHVEVIEGERESCSFGKAKDFLHILSRPQAMARLEEDFFDRVEYALAFSDDGYMTEKSFRYYISNYRYSMVGFLDSFAEKSIRAMEKEDYIIREMKDFIFNKEEKFLPTERGIKLYKKLITFKNYLEDYSLIKERDIDEVKIWTTI